MLLVKWDVFLCYFFLCIWHEVFHRGSLSVVHLHKPEALLYVWLDHILVSQARLTSAKREGSGELCIQTVSGRTVQYSPITLQYLVT